MQDDHLIQVTDQTAGNIARGVKEFAVVKRSVVVGGHKTSVSLEDAFWIGLKDIAMRRGLTLSTQIASIDTTRRTGNLSSAIRLYVLEHFRTRAASAMFIGERQTPSTRLTPFGSEIAATPPVLTEPRSDKFSV